MPDWVTDHPVRRTDRDHDRDRRPSRYMPGQVYRCLACDHEHPKEVAPTDSDAELITTQCPACESATRQLAVGRGLDTLTTMRADRRADP